MRSATVGSNSQIYSFWLDIVYVLGLYYFGLVRRCLRLGGLVVVGYLSLLYFVISWWLLFLCGRFEGGCLSVLFGIG